MAANFESSEFLFWKAKQTFENLESSQNFAENIMANFPMEQIFVRQFAGIETIHAAKAQKFSLQFSHEQKFVSWLSLVGSCLGQHSLPILPVFSYPGYQRLSPVTLGKKTCRQKGQQRSALLREKRLAKSTLIYRAGWTLTLPLKCQSQRWFPTGITCTGTWRNGRSGFQLQWRSCQMLLSVRARVVFLNGFRRSQNNSREKGSACEFGVLVQNMWITNLREWGFYSLVAGKLEKENISSRTA